MRSQLNARTLGRSTDPVAQGVSALCEDLRAAILYNDVDEFRRMGCFLKRARQEYLMSWKSVTDITEIDALRIAFGDFHDACLRECHIWTEHWVSKDLSMAISTDWDTHARLLIQRQGLPISAVELCFEEVRHFHLAPSPRDYASDIFSGLLVVRDDGIRWADHSDWLPDDPYAVDCTWIHAGKLRWRDASGWMGQQLRYGSPEEIPNVE